MTDEIYEDTATERAIEAAFGLKLNISEVVARQIATGFTSTATIFKTAPTMLYVFIQSQSNMALADVQKMVRSMNIDAGEFVPPHGDKDYFKRIGEAKFKAMYPGKHIMSDEDTRYQRTLAPYNPALIRVARVKGEIRAFHFESKSWRKVRDYAFSRISLK
jgi:hypothetical protein